MALGFDFELIDDGPPGPFAGPPGCVCHDCDTTVSCRDLRVCARGNGMVLPVGEPVAHDDITLEGWRERVANVNRKPWEHVA